MIGHYVKRALYYVSHPRQACGRIGAIMIGGRSVSYLYRDVMPYYAKRLFFYVSQPRRLAWRLGIFLGMRDSNVISYYAHRLFFYARHPRRMLWRLGIELSKRSGGLPPLGSPKYLANVMYNDALARFERDKHDLASAIGLMQTALALDDAPQIAVKLSELQRFANRADDAIATLRIAFHRDPNDRWIWYEALTYLLRFGATSDVLDLCRSILARDPEYPLAFFFDKIFAAYPNYVESLAQSIGNARDHAKRAHIVGVAVWGERYIKLFRDYTLASLLAEGNLPAIAERRDIHIAIFTAEQDARALLESPLYQTASRYCRFHFVHYDPALVAVSRVSDFPTACHAQFGLMSTAHYAMMECARRLEMDATVIGADNIVNKDFLSHLADASDRGASAVGCPGFRLPAAESLAAAEEFRAPDDRIISISGSDFATLLDKYLPKAVFVSADDFARFPLFLCWRVEGEGVLVHGNHYHPVMISGRHLKEIKAPSIDPIDGRFFVRYLLDLDKIYLSSQSEICLFDAAEVPLVAPPSLMKTNPFDIREVGWWLWQFDDGLREKYFRNPVRYRKNGAATSSRWDETEKQAAVVIEEILTYMHSLNNDYVTRGSWRL